MSVFLLLWYSGRVAVRHVNGHSMRTVTFSLYTCVICYRASTAPAYTSAGPLSLKQNGVDTLVITDSHTAHTEEVIAPLIDPPLAAGTHRTAAQRACVFQAVNRIYLRASDPSFCIFQRISHEFGERDRTCRCFFYWHFDFEGKASWTRRLGGIRQRGHAQWLQQRRQSHAIHCAQRRVQFQLASASSLHGRNLQDTAPLLHGSDGRRKLDFRGRPVHRHWNLPVPLSRARVGVRLQPAPAAAPPRSAAPS